MKRVIFVEPNIKNCDEIRTFFTKYNSDSRMVGMHICLVFPFRSELSGDYISDILNDVLKDQRSFSLTIKGTSISIEPKNNFLFLNVCDEDNYLCSISGELYKKLEGYAKLKGEYTPHITIGKCPDASAFEKMKEELSFFGEIILKASVDKVRSAIIMTDENGNTYLKTECEIELNR